MEQEEIITSILEKAISNTDAILLFWDKKIRRQWYWRFISPEKKFYLKMQKLFHDKQKARF